MKSNDISRAKIFAVQIHSGQFRKSSKDLFVYHLFRIDEFLVKNFFDLKNLNTLRVAALLHDSIEDTWVNKSFISENFSKEVADLVDELSKKGSQKAYTKSLQTASDYAKLIKLADIYDNIHDGFEGFKWSVFLKDSKKILQVLNVNDKEFKQRFEKIKKEALEKIELELSR
ncbi:MAG: HD domain-containing protein [Candidatus Woesearchaeota archaeon]